MFVLKVGGWGGDGSVQGSPKAPGKIDTCADTFRSIPNCALEIEKSRNSEFPAPLEESVGLVTLGDTEQGARRFPFRNPPVHPTPRVVGMGALSSHTPVPCMEMTWGLEVMTPLLSRPAPPSPSLGTSTPRGLFPNRPPALGSVVQGTGVPGA